MLVHQTYIDVNSQTKGSSSRGDCFSLTPDISFIL